MSPELSSPSSVAEHMGREGRGRRGKEKKGGERREGKRWGGGERGEQEEREERRGGEIDPTVLYQSFTITLSHHITISSSASRHILHVYRVTTPAHWTHGVMGLPLWLTGHMGLPL